MLDPLELPTNSSLLKLIEFRKNEQLAYDKMKHFGIDNPKFFTTVEEMITRKHKPQVIHLTEVRQDELIYYENIENCYLDKRTLGPN